MGWVKGDVDFEGGWELERRGTKKREGRVKRADGWRSGAKRKEEKTDRRELKERVKKKTHNLLVVEGDQVS